MYQLNEEQKMFQESIRQFAKDVVEPRAAEIDAKGEFPWDMVEKLKENGFMGLPFAEEYGGEGADLLTLCVAIEELAKVCVNTSLIIGCQELGSTPIKLGGNDEQKKKYLPQLASGEKLVGFGLTEPEAGSDAAAMKTRAVKKGDKYIINGTKCFITNGGVGEIFSVFGMTDPDKGVVFHCSNLPKDFFGSHKMDFQEIIAGTVGKENTYGTIVGKIAAGPFTYCRVSTDDLTGKVRAYIGEGQFTDDKLDSFGGYGTFHVNRLQALLQYICKQGFEHHVAINPTRIAAGVKEALGKYLGWDVYLHE